LLIASTCDKRTLFSITLQLLDSGANVHFVNQALEARGGSALHEAARNRNEQMADLLLAHGAYPFQLNPAGRYAGRGGFVRALLPLRGCNQPGGMFSFNDCVDFCRTCLEEAVASDFAPLLRKFEVYAPWRGMVAIKVRHAVLCLV
jgi:hypothetical protein